MTRAYKMITVALCSSWEHAFCTSAKIFTPIVIHRQLHTVQNRLVEMLSPALWSPQCGQHYQELWTYVPRNMHSLVKTAKCLCKSKCLGHPIQKRWTGVSCSAFSCSVHSSVQQFQLSSVECIFARSVARGRLPNAPGGIRHLLSLRGTAHCSALWQEKLMLFKSIFALRIKCFGPWMGKKINICNGNQIPVVLPIVIFSAVFRRKSAFTRKRVRIHWLVVRSCHFDVTACAEVSRLV